jgi:hypothetical protein
VARNRILILVLTFLLAFTLLATSLVAAGWADEPPGAQELAEISEATGLVAVVEPFSPACAYDGSYGVYLCPEVEPAARPERNPVAAARARQMLANGGLLLVPESDNDRVMAFDPQTGDLVDADFIPADPAHLTIPINAILSAGGDSILVSDQSRDVVQEYDLNGNYLDVFAPAGGADLAILDNIRGIALRPNGNLLVTVGSGSNINAVAEFDTAGNYLGNFVANGAGGLASPFEVYQRAGDWLVGGITSDAIHRYALATGAYLDDFSPINTFPEQIAEAGNGNVLVGNFSGTQEGVVEFTPDGSAIVDIYDPLSPGGYRGVYELPNGNILTSNSDGVHEIDRLGNLVETKISGPNARFIEWVAVGVARITLDKTVGSDPTVCAASDSLTLPLGGGEVTYCYLVRNTGSITLTHHDLVDDHLGPIVTGFPYTLAPGASTFLTQTAMITQTTVNSATWRAFISGMPTTTLASDTALVTVGVSQPDIVVAPPALTGTQAPDTQVTQTLTISNAGAADLVWQLEEEPALARPVVPVPSLAPRSGQPLPGAETSNGYTAAQPGLVPAGNGPTITATFTVVSPTIDGVINGPEWSDALALDIAQGAQPVIMYAKHDGNYLYLAFDDAADPTLDALDQVGIYFDDEGGVPPILYDNAWTNAVCGPANTGEGNLWLGNLGPNPDQWRAWITGAIDCPIQYGGTGIQIAYSLTGGHVQYEAAIPLDGASALVAGSGQTIGFRVYTLDNATATFTGRWPAVSDFADPATYGNLHLAAGGCAGGDIPWASVSPGAGTTGPGASSLVDVIFDTAGLSPGSYSGSLCISSNDPDEPTITVPLSLTVEVESWGFYLPMLTRQ